MTGAPLPIGLDRETAQVGTDGAPTQVPLADALIRGAWATGAAVRVVPHAGPVTDGVGAILRWADGE